MATAPQTTPAPLTAEEFARRPDPGHPEELVKGRIRTMPPPGIRHGLVGAQAAFLVKLSLTDHDLGRVVGNDSGVITERGPDSVRGPDVAYYSYDRLPRGARPPGYGDRPPDLAFEVLSPEDRWPKVLGKVAEYLNAGVTVVGMLDPDRETLHLFAGDQPVRALGRDDELTLPDLLPDFRVRVGRFFA